MGALITRRRQIACKIEAIEGTAETLTNADANLLVIDPKAEVGIGMFKRDPSRASMSNMAQIPGARSMKITFKIELKGSGTAGTSPAIGKLLQACGFSETVVPVTSVTYLPASSGIKTVTMALYNDGVIYKMKGARGTVKLTHKVGEPVMMEFEFTGVYVSVTDGAMLTSITYESTIPPAFLSALLSVASYSAVLSAVDLDIGNTVALRESVNEADGYLSAIISKREPKGSFDPEMCLVATHDFFGKWKGGNESAFTETVGATPGNICTITAPKLQYIGITDGDRNGISLAQTNFALNMNSGDDELSLAFT